MRPYSGPRCSRAKFWMTLGWHAMNIWRAVDRLSLLSAQDALLLLRVSFSAPRVQRLLRCEPSVDNPALDLSDRYLRSALSRITNTSFSDTQPVTKRYNLVPVKGRWCPAAGKVTAGLASHWPCFTDFSGLSTYGLTAYTPHGVWHSLPFYMTTRWLVLRNKQSSPGRPSHVLQHDEHDVKDWHRKCDKSIGIFISARSSSLFLSSSGFINVNITVEKTVVDCWLTSANGQQIAFLVSAHSDYAYLLFVRFENTIRYDMLF